MEPPAITPQPQPAPQNRSKRNIGFWALIVLIVVVCSSGAAYATYAWQHQQVTSLQSQVSSLQSQLAAKSKKKLAKKTGTKKASPSPSASPAL